MRRIFLLIIVLAGLLPATFPTYACSGGPTFDDVFELWPTLVYAEVMEVDAHGQNAILRVREVLSGAADERVLLVRNEPGQTVGVAEGLLGNGDCHGFASPLSQGDSFYIHLRHELHGGYSGGWVYRFDADAPPVPEGSDFEPLSAIWENEAAFRADITALTGVTPYDPTPLALGLPRRAPLHLTLSDGSTHLLPVDSDTPLALDTLDLKQAAEYGFWQMYFPAFAEDSMGCLPPDCEVSPDGAFLVRNQTDMTEVRFGEAIPSEARALSPVGGFVAAAYKDQVTIYRLNYVRNGNAGSLRVVEKIFTRDQTSDPHPHFQWSADGRRLAFTDGLGLWVWDVYTSDTPTLIRPRAESGHLPFSRGFSPLGNYVEVLQGDSIFWLETQPDGEELPWGFWSPDEVSLLTQRGDDIEICPAIDLENCQSVLTRVMNTGGDVSIFHRLRGAAWHTPYQLTYWACDVGDEECNAIEVNVRGYWSEEEVFPTPYVSQFVFQADVNHLALMYGRDLVIDGRTILTEEGEARIIGLRWLRPLWAVAF